MNLDKNEAQKLPDGWVLCTSKSNPGRKYYFNRKTGKSSWTEPQADERSDDKRKSKKEKTNIKEKRKKEESSKKNLKRRSDDTGGHSSSSSKKKYKEEIQSSDHVNIIKKISPAKCSNICKRESLNNRDESIKRQIISNRQSLAKKQRRESLGYTEDINQRESTGKQENACNNENPRKKTPSKNIANARLSQFRAQLNAEIQKEENKERSPIKSKQRSPIQTETSSKVKNDKSPNTSESKNTQSPSSDSLSSIPSPSQFFAANKIISSMKAQLPEEYCNKLKQKDTFADIEQGICNQTTEYPFMKHPATPPQFSEASKLVSAIKSKLTYKAPCKETTVIQKFASAKDRLESLRARLSSEVMDMAIDDFVYANEAMDVDFKETNQSVPVSNCKKDNKNSNNDNVVLVVDTNIFIHELDFIKNVLDSHIKGYSEQPTLLVPWRVINELDRLKDNNNGNGAICKRAKSAMDYLYKSLPENSRIKGQSLRDANSHIYPCELPDDEILNCCLQQQDRGISVILLSNDKNLCNKACINSVKCIGLNELRGLLENKERGSLAPALLAGLAHTESTVYQLLANVLENEMRAKYNNLWQHVLFKAPPWTLADVLQCLLKHWIAVFGDVFPRIEHLITDLRNSLVAIENKDPKTLSQSEVSNFNELCLEIAKKCQIIPEYMELAKTTVERLVRRRDPAATGQEQESGPGSGEGQGQGLVPGEGQGQRPGDGHERAEGQGPAHDAEGEMLVIDAFEGVWTVFSSYCAKLCTSLGVEHSIEDKLSSSPAPPAAPSPLLARLPAFSDTITALTLAIEGVLSVEPLDPNLEDQMSRLEVAFRESLSSVCMDETVVNRNNLRVFCVKCRNMLQEAYTKFTQLSELLGVCRNINVDS